MGQSVPSSKADLANAAFYPKPRYFIQVEENSWPTTKKWVLSYRDIARATDFRTSIAALIPYSGAGHTLPVLILSGSVYSEAIFGSLFLANQNALVFDFVVRQKVQSTHFSYYILEQLPVIPPDRFTATHFGPKTAADIIRAAVLELTYTAHDMAPFARDMGYVDAAGSVKPPFFWDEDRRLTLRAKLDAVFFHLYGITNRDDVRYIYSTFPIVEREERAAYGKYRSCELCLAYMNALSAGKPDAEIRI